jgi:hypothetical protein
MRDVACADSTKRDGTCGQAAGAMLGGVTWWGGEDAVGACCGVGLTRCGGRGHGAGLERLPQLCDARGEAWRRRGRRGEGGLAGWVTWRSRCRGVRSVAAVLATQVWRLPHLGGDAPAHVEDTRGGVDGVVSGRVRRGGTRRVSMLEAASATRGETGGGGGLGR